MASLSEKVITALNGSTGVTSVVGQRFYRMRAPQDVKVPYIIVWMPSHERVSHMRGVTNLEYPVIRFDFFGANFKQLDELRDSVITLMAQTFGATYRFGTELYEDDTRLFHLMADFSVWNTVGS